MKSFIPAAMILAVSSTPAFAMENPVGTTTAVGIGAAKSTAISNSNSRATAIGGGNATGGNARSNAQGGVGIGVGTGGAGGNVTIQGTPANTSQTITTQGTTTVRSAPSVFAPGLAAAGIESCLGSVSGGASFIGTGFSFGSSTPDTGCNARLSARTLWSFGLKKAAVAVMCGQPDVYAAMPDVCAVYLPRPVAYAPVVPVAYPVVEPAPADYYYSDLSAYRGGPIMLSEGSTGRERLCDNYDAARHHCRSWHGVVSSKPKQVSRPVLRVEHQSAVSPSVVAQPPIHPVSKLTESLGRPLWITMIHPEQKPVVPPSEPKKELPNDDESTRNCLGFCAVAGGLKR